VWFFILLSLYEYSWIILCLNKKVLPLWLLPLWVFDEGFLWYLAFWLLIGSLCHSILSRPLDPGILVHPHSSTSNVQSPAAGDATWGDTRHKSTLFKNTNNRRKECDIYLTQVCRYLCSVERSRWKHKDQELSANTVVFVSCRNRLTIVLAGAIRGRPSWIGGEHGQNGIWELVNDADGPVFLERELMNTG